LHFRNAHYIYGQIEKVFIWQRAMRGIGLAFIVVSTLAVVSYRLTGCQDPVSLIFAPIGLGCRPVSGGFLFLGIGFALVNQ
jgi:hypothetical protein